MGGKKTQITATIQGVSDIIIKKMTVDSSVYSAHFYDLLTSNDRYIIAFGSRGERHIT